MDGFPPTTQSQPSAPVPGNSKKILIVEDDFFIRDLYAIQAKKAGFAVVTADDGEAGVAEALAESPDLILLDLMLPKLDGISAIKAIKANPKFVHTPCVLITNLADSSKEQEALAAGAAAYMLKIKFTPEKVIEAIKQYLPA